MHISLTIKLTLHEKDNNDLVCNIIIAANELSAQTPTITCPANITVSTDPGYCTRVVNNIDPVVVPVKAHELHYFRASFRQHVGSASGKSFPKGVSTITYYMPEYPGVTCSFTVTVVDTNRR